MTGTVVSWDDEQRCGAGSVRRLRRSSTRGGTRVADATTHNATPIGTLISSTQRHPKALVITPPSIGPSAPAEPDVALQIESARASCSPVWVIVSRLRLLGTKAAAPTPWAQTAQLAANADESALHRIETVLSDAGYLVAAVSSFQLAREMLDSIIPDLLVADGLHMTPAGYRIWTAALKPMPITIEIQIPAR